MNRYLFKYMCERAGIELGKDNVGEALRKINALAATPKPQAEPAPSAVQPYTGSVLRPDVFGKPEAVVQGGQLATALDMVLSEEECAYLWDAMGDDRADLCSIRLTVGDGHSGYGLYVSSPDYPEEGALFVRHVAASPPAPERVALTPQELGILMAVADIESGGVTTIFPEFKRELQGVLRKVIAAFKQPAIKHLPSDDTEGGAV